jgi:hypothetical protein
MLDEELCTGAYEIDGIVGRENTGYIEGSIFAQAVASYEGRRASPQNSEASECHLHAGHIQMGHDRVQRLRVLEVDLSRDQGQEGGEAMALCDAVETDQMRAEDGNIVE